MLLYLFSVPLLTSTFKDNNFREKCKFSPYMKHALAGRKYYVYHTTLCLALIFVLLKKARFPNSTSSFGFSTPKEDKLTRRLKTELKWVHHDIQKPGDEVELGKHVWSWLWVAKKCYLIQICMVHFLPASACFMKGENLHLISQVISWKSN